MTLRVCLTEKSGMVIVLEGKWEKTAADIVDLTTD